MNTFLIVYLCILISKALVNTALKYVWRARAPGRAVVASRKTEAERQRSLVLRGALRQAPWTPGARGEELLVQTAGRPIGTGALPSLRVWKCSGLEK